MKLAFFSSMVTDGHPTTGYEIANECVVDGLRELGHEVHVFGFRLPRQKSSASSQITVLDTISLENSDASAIQKARWIAASFRERIPVAAAKLVGFSQSRLAEIIDEKGLFDGYIINSYQMAAAYPLLLKKQFIYVAHNVEHRSAAENALSSGSALQRYLYRREERLLKKIESQYCQDARYVWTFSEDDLQGHSVPGERGCVLRLTTPDVDVSPTKDDYSHDAGLIGTWSWQPNLVGLKWFLDEVVPNLPNDFSIAIAGSVPGGINSPHPGVKFLGRVESASEFLSSVRLVPLISRGGTGVQLKTIEALQAGLACVATESSVRGIESLPKNCLLANDPIGFANSLLELKQESLAGKLPKVDGREFYGLQRTTLLSGLSLGLSRFA